MAWTDSTSNLVRLLLMRQGTSDPLVHSAMNWLVWPPSVPTSTINIDTIVGKNPRRAVGAAVTGNRDRIYISDKSPAYKKRDTKRIAAMLAHEDAHIKGAGEPEAYTVESELLSRLGYNRKEIDRLKRLATEWGSEGAIQNKER